MMLCELNRMSSHLLFQATNGMDIGAVSMMLYGWREREEVLRYFEYVTGLRMNHNYIRPGGVAADLPDGWQERRARGVRHRRSRRRRVRRAAVGEPDLARAHGRHRHHHHRGVPRAQHHRPDPALDRVRVGPAQGAAVPRVRRGRLRRHLHGATATCSTATASGSPRSSSRSRSCASASSSMPAGDYRVQDKKLTPPPRARIDESMEALIHHFKLFTEGFKVPAGETYVAIESPRGEIGCYMVSDGSGKPVRMHIRGPSFYNLQAIEPMGKAASSPTRSRSCRASTRSWARSTGELLHRREPARRRARSSRSTRGRSRRSCRSRTSRRIKSGWLSPEAMDEIAELTGVTPADVQGTCSFYTMFKRRPCGQLLVSVCTNVTCLVTGGPEVLEHLESKYALDDDVTVEEVECLAACGGAPAMQVNYEFHERVTPELGRRDRRGVQARRTARRARSRERRSADAIGRAPHRHQAAARPSRRLVDDRRRGRDRLLRRAAGRARDGRPGRRAGAGEASGLRGRGGANFSTAARSGRSSRRACSRATSS